MINFDKNQQQIIRQTVDKYGDKQLMQAVEEMAELMQALSKYQRVNDTKCKSFAEFDDLAQKVNKACKNIIEEIADVYIMLRQLQLIFCINDTDIELEIDRKLNRQKERNAEND